MTADQQPDPTARPAGLPETITRVDIVRRGAGAAEHFAQGWDVHLLDDGRTLRLIARGDQAQAEAARLSRNEALGRDLATIHRVHEKYEAQRRPR